jgi:NAD(P)H-dependent flavin oxidoreductase YrpB (nitropropane dioxygenase family)
MAAALARAGVRVGTRFVATEEAGAHPRYLEALLSAGGQDTVYTDRRKVPGRIDPPRWVSGVRSPLMAGVPDRLTAGQIAFGWPAGQLVSGLKG